MRRFADAAAGAIGPRANARELKAVASRMPETHLISIMLFRRDDDGWYRDATLASSRASRFIYFTHARARDYAILQRY